MPTFQQNKLARSKIPQICKELALLRLEREKDRGALVTVRKVGVPTGVCISRVVCREDDSWTTYYRERPERLPEELDNVEA